MALFNIVVRNFIEVDIIQIHAVKINVDDIIIFNRHFHLLPSDKFLPNHQNNAVEIRILFTGLAEGLKTTEVDLEFCSRNESRDCIQLLNSIFSAPFQHHSLGIIHRTSMLTVNSNIFKQQMFRFPDQWCQCLVRIELYR